jgi:hypothetical protein
VRRAFSRAARCCAATCCACAAPSLLAAPPDEAGSDPPVHPARTRPAQHSAPPARRVRRHGKRGVASTLRLQPWSRNEHYSRRGSLKRNPGTSRHMSRLRSPQGLRSFRSPERGLRSRRFASFATPHAIARARVKRRATRSLAAARRCRGGARAVAGAEASPEASRARVLSGKSRHF